MNRIYFGGVIKSFVLLYVACPRKGDLAMGNNISYEDTISLEEIEEIKLKYDDTSIRRRLTQIWSRIVTIIAVVFSLFQLYTAIFGSLAPQLQRSIHLSFALVLIFLLFPFSRKKNDVPLHSYDIMLSILSSLVAIYWIAFYVPIIFRAGDLILSDYVMGIVAVLLVLEGTRRVCGYPVFIIGIVALLYCYYGSYLPGFLQHRGFSLERIVAHMYLSTEGMLGIPIGVVSTFVFLFVLFGAFLTKTGVGQFFNDFANALTGSAVGGPAKVAVISSALQGTISGSSIANTVASGSFTIPMMKKIGYRPEFAAAVEASASTGGQLMPPIMGAAAFLMAEFTGIPYMKVALAAAIPAILYFTGIFMAVHIEARKVGLKGLPKEKVPALMAVIKNRGILFIPVIVIVVVLASGYTPMRAGLWGIASAIAVGAVYKEHRMGLNDFIDALETGAKTALGVAVVSATAGIVVGTISLTGLGLKLATGLVDLAGGNLLITMCLTMISSLVLGMGVPTTANYVITSTICAPALMQLGVPIIAAHLFVFYFGIIADITPPVCSAAFAGAGIAKADPLKTGYNASKLAIGAFIVPYIFVLSPCLVLVDVNILDLIKVIPTAILGMAAISSGVIGWMYRDLTILQRILIVFGGIALIDPHVLSDLVGLGLIMFVLFYGRYATKKEAIEND